MSRSSTTFPPGNIVQLGHGVYSPRTRAARSRPVLTELQSLLGAGWDRMDLLDRKLASQAADCLADVRGIDTWLTSLERHPSLLRDRLRPRPCAVVYLRAARGARRTLASLPPAVSPLLDELGQRIDDHRSSIRERIDGRPIDPVGRPRACAALLYDLVDELIAIHGAATAMHTVRRRRGAAQAGAEAAQAALRAQYGGSP